LLAADSHGSQNKHAVDEGGALLTSPGIACFLEKIFKITLKYRKRNIKVIHKRRGWCAVEVVSGLQ